MGYYVVYVGPLDVGVLLSAPSEEAALQEGASRLFLWWGPYRTPKELEEVKAFKTTREKIIRVFGLESQVWMFLSDPEIGYVGLHPSEVAALE